MTTSTPFRYLLHGTDGFTSPPKEGVLRIFSPLKIQRLRSGLKPRTWVLKGSTLPLDHRSPDSIDVMAIQLYLGTFFLERIFAEQLHHRRHRECSMQTNYGYYGEIRIQNVMNACTLCSRYSNKLPVFCIKHIYLFIEQIRYSSKKRTKVKHFIIQLMHTT